MKLDTEVTVSLVDLGCDYDDEDIEDILSDYLSDTFGYCHNGFVYEIDESTNTVNISDIEWDFED